MVQAFPHNGKIADANGIVTPEFRKLLAPLEILSQISPERLSKLLGVADESGSILDVSESAAAGDMPYRGDGAWERLPIGAIGALLGINAAGNAPEWQDAGGQWLNHISDTGLSGTSTNITGFGDYNHVLVQCHGIAGSGAASLRCSFETAAGAVTIMYSRAFITGAAIGGASDASSAFAEIGQISGAADNGIATILILNIKSGQNKSSLSWQQSIVPSAMLGTTHILTTEELTGLNIEISAGTFSAGIATLYGIK
jgi:hypothetical protein